jgi:hypothetical protein
VSLMRWRQAPSTIQVRIGRPRLRAVGVEVGGEVGEVVGGLVSGSAPSGIHPGVRCVATNLTPELGGVFLQYSGRLLVHRLHGGQAAVWAHVAGGIPPSRTRFPRPSAGGEMEAVDREDGGDGQAPAACPTNLRQPIDVDAAISGR